MNDFKSSYDTIEECFNEYHILEREKVAEYYQVFDSEERKVLDEGDWYDFISVQHDLQPKRQARSPKGKRQIKCSLY